MKLENYVEIEPRKVKAVQFNDLKDFSCIQKGYIQTRGNFESLFISEAMPRSMDCRFAYILSFGIKRMEIKIGDWVVTNEEGKVKSYSDKKFQKKFRKSDEIKVQDSEATK